MDGWRRMRREREVLLPYSIISFFSLLFVALLMHTFLFLYILFPSFFLKLGFIDGDIYSLFSFHFAALGECKKRRRGKGNELSWMCICIYKLYILSQVKVKGVIFLSIFLPPSI